MYLCTLVPATVTVVVFLHLYHDILTHTSFHYYTYIHIEDRNCADLSI